MIDSRLCRRIVHQATPEDGGYRVTFEGCGHVVWFAVDPGRTSYCGGCMDELISEIREGKHVDPISLQEFLLIHAQKLAQSQKDAQTLSAAAFIRKYGIAPNDYQHRVRLLRELAACHASGGGAEAIETIRILLMMWSRWQE